jgi:predicted nuclease of predicted toxin-antitoxin system
MRFHLDEHVSPAVADGLRRLGVDVTTTQDADLLSAPDERQLEFARNEGRVIFTNDSDFVSFASANFDHPGIAYCDRGARSIGEIIRYLCLMHDCMEPDEMRGKVAFI